MLKAPTEFLVTFIIISVILMLSLVVLITVVIYRYQQKQNTYFKDIEALKISHQNSLLQSQLEIQEQTFQNISREIHDNIGQKLTLAKLHLNTLSHDDINKVTSQVNDSVSMISEVINDLSDISRSMNSEILLNNGLIKALEFEAVQFKKSGRYKISFSTTGNPVFLDANTELVLFRIAQEALTNIIKHADASVIDILLHYDSLLLSMIINDNGKGFHADENRFGTGLSNMRKRADTLKGRLVISSNPQGCTQIKIEIPLYENNKSI
ncbi:MAG: sensor histidine kinase [Chitinophagaceae bacterium]|nr:sensor histidine kinase [Chitinophagaceae bacterium]